MRGEVRSKEEAREEYDETVTSGHTSLYGEQMGKDMFRMLLGNLFPGESAELRVSLLQELHREEGEEGPLRFSLPTTLKPRYSPADTSCGVDTEYELSVVMSLGYEGGLSRVESPSHKIRTKLLERGVWQVQMNDPNPLEKDFMVLFYPIDPSVPSLIWGRPSEIATDQKCIHGTAAKTHPFAVSSALMLSFLPLFSREAMEEVNSEIIFVIDRSGSMQGEAIASARATLDLLLRSISPGCAINVVGFGSNFSMLFPEGSRSYHEDTLQIAVEYARAMQADLGGTEILSPLQHLFSCALLPGLSRQVLLLTDGAVSNTEQVLSCVRENRSRARVFAIGIGSGVSSELVRGVAEAGGGRAVFVREGERMQGKIMKLLSEVMCPCFTDVELKGPNSVSLFPRNQLQLFPTDRLVAYGLVEPGVSLQGKNIVLSYKYREEHFSHELSLDCTGLDTEGGEWVHKLACNAALREWEYTPSREKECVQLSCDTNIVCVSTALVGVECEGGRILEGSMQHIKLRPPQPFFNKKTAVTHMQLGIVKCGKHGHAKQVFTNSNHTGLSFTKIPTVFLSPHEQLISQQTAEGYWKCSETVTQLLGISEKGRDICPKGMEEREWTTLLCLLTLEIKYTEFEDEWKLLAKKGWRWLRESQSVVTLEEAMKAGKMVVH